MIGADTSPAAIAQARLREGRPDEALAIIEPLARAHGASHANLAAYAGVLKALGRPADALAVNQAAAQAYPDSAVAEHNLGATLGDMDRWAEAEQACRRAFAKGGDAPETWQLLGRSLMNIKRLDEGEAALRKAVDRNPALADAQRDLAQLIWMRSGDRDASVAVLRQAVAARPGAPQLALELARALQFGGDLEGAYRAARDGLARAGAPSVELQLAAANVAIARKDGAAVLEHARQALMIDPTSVSAGVCACDGYLQLGEAEQAARLGLKLYQATAVDQAVIARLATAWRLLGDPRYHQLYDYDAFVGAGRIDAPDGWTDVPGYLADLDQALRNLHAFETHPFDQSLRGGSQTSQDLSQARDPAIRAFFQAIDGPIRRYMDGLGAGGGVLRGRNTGRYAFSGMWSVMLRPNGFHVDHVHPLGWLSSACYIDLPTAVQGEGREGWIKFGEPGVATTPALEAERFVRPEPGMLVLFPSYMWHGTVPFTGETNRLTIAFDVIPA